MTEQTQSPLAILAGPLEDLEYYVDLKPVQEDGLYERLYLTLDVDEERPELEYGLEIYFINDVMEAFGSDTDAEEAVVTQFMLVLPFSFLAETLLEAMRLCNYVNRLLPMGAFGVSEEDGAVFLRYCLASESRAVPESVVIEVVQALEFACREYGPHFEKISLGQSAVKEFLGTFEESGHQIPSVGSPELFRAG
ncbi:YbjN domain-containing protein [Verrucomicrobium sp. BvORR106]|uniref:YbjN domain-containing protein n=1 Tax=Verrucomicrobium sp. BvORR106 TaxID=1403819 RepID=UPI000570ACEE|nr:YbjN domain-containing protein [Verrucomicrobium sp. BvORR106]